MRWMPIMLVLLLAGCAEDSQTTDEAHGGRATEVRDTEGDRSTATPMQHNVTLQLSGTQVAVLARLGLGGTNCAGFDVDRVINGTATATWDPEIIVLDRLELGIFGETGDAKVTGTSPLRLEFGKVTRDDFFGDVKIMIQAPEGSAVIDQPAAVEVSFWYVGGSAGHGLGSCSFS